jgi:hypothetical protein
MAERKGQGARAGGAKAAGAKAAGAKGKGAPATEVRARGDLRTGHVETPPEAREHGEHLEEGKGAKASKGRKKP